MGLMAYPKKISRKQLVAYIEKQIPDFHEARLASLRKLKLPKILKRKNPYLFKVKNLNVASELVKSLLDAHLSSQEETIFGTFLEGLAIYIAEQIYDGRKSTAQGIDLELSKDGVLYLISIKSGPNWGNSSQIQKMKDNFRKAARIFRTNAISKPLMAINGCCYGQDSRSDKGDYQKLCGQAFWEFLSGDAALYLELIEPMSNTTKERNEEFNEAFAKVVNGFTQEFIRDFCTADHAIDWRKLLVFNSGIK